MGYFNYFVKCIIRNITYKLCKPKVFLTVLLSVVILFVLHSYGYCAEWTDTERQTILNYLNSMDGHVSSLHYGLDNLYGMIDEDNTEIIELLDSINTCQLNIQNAIQSIESGTDVLVNYTGQILSIQNQILAVETETRNALNNIYNEISANTDKLEEILAVDTEIRNALNNIYNEIHDINLFLQQTLTELDNIDTSIQEGNQLQEENNQIQQEQNDLIKDDNVDTEGFEFAKDDTANPTEDGFNTLFMAIYDAFCNTSSKPLTITLPYVNETFTIQPNLVSNAMQKSGLGFIATLIHSFYYYGVCLFIYKDINKIIEHLKSGNLTADCGNVKTEVL